MADTRVCKEVEILPAEHAYLLKMAGSNDSDAEPFIIIQDKKYNYYNIGDYVKPIYQKALFGTYWKITGITYCFRYVENPEFERTLWETKEKMRKVLNDGGQREYAILYLEKSTYSQAEGELPDPGEC